MVLFARRLVALAGAHQSGPVCERPPSSDRPKARCPEPKDLPSGRSSAGRSGARAHARARTCWSARGLIGGPSASSCPLFVPRGLEASAKRRHVQPGPPPPPEAGETSAANNLPRCQSSGAPAASLKTIERLEILFQLMDGWRRACANSSQRLAHVPADLWPVGAAKKR